MQLRPTRSPFFPYTTLFRSRMKGVDETGANGIAVADGKALRPLPVAWGLRQNEVVNVERRRGLEVINEITSIEIIDRKSTRLNSSHLGISYAVFCLKKKRKQ